jgi:hypothetical protein
MKKIILFIATLLVAFSSFAKKSVSYFPIFYEFPNIGLHLEAEIGGVHKVLTSQDAEDADEDDITFRLVYRDMFHYDMDTTAIKAALAFIKTWRNADVPKGGVSSGEPIPNLIKVEPHEIRSRPVWRVKLKQLKDESVFVVPVETLEERLIQALEKLRQMQKSKKHTIVAWRRWEFYYR